MNTYGYLHCDLMQEQLLILSLKDMKTYYTVLLCGRYPTQEGAGERL